MMKQGRNAVKSLAIACMIFGAYLLGMLIIANVMTMSKGEWQFTPASAMVIFDRLLWGASFVLAGKYGLDFLKTGREEKRCLNGICMVIFATVFVIMVEGFTVIKLLGFAVPLVYYTLFRREVKQERR